jgi:CRISPR/Cas system CMR-associated protein Cmr5 small subunit
MDLDQLRAHNAFTHVQGLDRNRSEFLALARKLPFMLHTNGLLATWAHLLARPKKAPENARALQALSTHLRAVAVRLRLDVAPAGDEQKIFDRWVNAQNGLTGFALRKNTAEALAFSTWLKRAAEALCDAGTPEASPPPAEISPAGEGTPETAL